MKKKRSTPVFLLAGWIAGAAAVLLLGVGWPRVLPSGQNLEQFYGTRLGPPLVTLAAILIASPSALIGGLIGSRIPREGGRTEQYIAAALAGIILALPFGCLVMWYLTP